MAVHQRTRVRTTRRQTAEARVSLKQWRAWFTEDGGEGGEADDKGGGGEEKKLAQSEVDKLIGKTRTETRKSAQQEATAEILKRLGVEKLEDAEAVLKANRERTESEKTELQKALDAKALLEKERDEAKHALTTFQEQVQLKERLAARDSAITKALHDANAKADKVLKLLKADRAEEMDAILKEDGTVDETKVKTLVAAAKTAYPEDFGNRSTPGTGSHSGGRSPRQEVPKVITSGRL